MFKNILRVFSLTALALLLSSCAIYDFKKMDLPAKPAAAAATSVTQVQTAATAAGNQPGIVTLANQANVLIKRMRDVQRLQLQNFTAGAVEHDYTPSRDAALKLVPALWKLEYGARTLYLFAQEAPSGFSAEGMALAKQGFSYADLSAAALALDLGYPISGIEWNAAYLSSKHEAQMNAYTTQLIAAAKKFDVSAQRFVDRLAAVQARGDAVTSLKPLDIVMTHRMTVSVIGKASESDRDRLAAALKKAAAEMPPLPNDVVLTVDLSHLGGTFLPSRTTVMVLGPLMAEVHGDVTFSASAQVGDNEPTKLVIDMGTMQAKETDHLVVLATTAILSRAAVAAYGEGWQQATSKVATQ